jgi:hypothetical protein
MNEPKPENTPADFSIEQRSSINDQYEELQRLIKESERKKREKQDNVVNMPGAKAPPAGKKGKTNALNSKAPSQLTMPQANHLIYVNPEPRIIVPGTAIPPPQPAETAAESSLFLPGWHSECRGVPNGLLRSALFAAIRPTHERRRIKKETLASVDGLTVVYSGDQLDQGDLDVYEGELHFAMIHGIPLGKPVLHSDAAFLKSLGRGTGRKEYVRLRDSQLRMVGGVVEIKYGRYSYAGTLINDLYRDEKLKMTGPVFNPKLLALFQDGSYSSVYWEHRMALGDSPLAQWLHGHYSSHKQPFDYTVARLHELCGSETKNLFKFRQNLHGALEKLAGVTGWRCEIVTGDKVRVDRTGGVAEVLLTAKKPGKSPKKDKGDVSE